MNTSPFEEVLRLSLTKQCSIQKHVNFKAVIREMYPPIPWELGAVPLGSAEHNLRTAVVRFYSVCSETARIFEKCLTIEE
jgi:hypothetical protein